MDNNEERLPVALALRTSAIDRLIQSRQQNSVMALARMNTDELRQLQRNYYHQAIDSDLITFINLTIRMLGTYDEVNKRVRWSQNGGSVVINASFDCATSTTEIIVNDQVVCSNGKPGEEIFLPGNWLRTMNEAFQLAEAQALSKEKLGKQAEKERLILDLSADV